MAPADETYFDGNQSGYEQNDEVYMPDTNYDEQYETCESYQQEIDMQQYAANNQYDEGTFYQEDCYAIPENFEHASEYDQQQQYYYPPKTFDGQFQFQQEPLYQNDEDCETLESYDATEQYRIDE